MKKIIFTITILLSTSLAWAGWVVQSSGTTNDLYDVYFVDGNHGWAVGKWGTIKKTTNGNSWQTEASNTTKWILTVWFTGLSNGWNGTEMGYPYNGEIFKYNGNSWSSQYFPPMGQPGQFQSIYMLNNSNGWACGGDAIFHFDGNDWNTNASGFPSPLYEIWFVNSNNGWAVGASGLIAHYSGGGWSSQTYGYHTFNSVCFTDSNHGWAVGNSGTIYFYNGSTWVQQTSNTTVNLKGVYFVSNTNGYAVGEYGTILHYNGSNWSTMTSGTTQNLNSIYFVDSQRGYAVGANGTILKYECSGPNTPTAISATNISQTSFNARWNQSNNANGYYLDVATDNGFNNFVSGYNNLDVGNVTDFTVSGLYENTDYFYRVRAYDDCGTSSNSNTIPATTLPFPPNAPVATTATNITQTSFEANWNYVSGADGYYLDVATDIMFNYFVPGFENLDVGNTLEYTVSGLKATTYYYYRLRAYNISGISNNSNVINLTTLPAGIGETKKSNVNIYVSRNILHVNIKSVDATKTNVTLYDLSGFQIIKKDLKGNKKNTLLLTVDSGVYLVKVIVNEKVYLKKVYFQGK